MNATELNLLSPNLARRPVMIGTEGMAVERYGCRPCFARDGWWAFSAFGQARFNTAEALAAHLLAVHGIGPR